jgi:hypothetical protein
MQGRRFPTHRDFHTIDKGNQPLSLPHQASGRPHIIVIGQCERVDAEFGRFATSSAGASKPSETFSGYAGLRCAR